LGFWHLANEIVMSGREFLGGIGIINT
jgi:hypothetical protein